MNDSVWMNECKAILIADWTSRIGYPRGPAQEFKEVAGCGSSSRRRRRSLLYLSVGVGVLRSSFSFLLRVEMIKKKIEEKGILEKRKKRWPYKGNSPTIIPSPPCSWLFREMTELLSPKSDLQSLLLSESRKDFKFLLSPHHAVPRKAFRQILLTPLSLLLLCLLHSMYKMSDFQSWNHPRRISSSERKCGT